MNCIEARRMVTPFVDRELTDKETEQFLEHIESCSDCRDELDIYFTVYHALNSLDSGAHHEFNFKIMLEEDIREAKRGVMRRKALRAIRGIMLVAAEVLLLVSVITGYEMKQGEISHSTFQKAIYRLYAQKLDDLPDTGDQEREEIFDEVHRQIAETERVRTETEQTESVKEQSTQTEEIQKQSAEEAHLQMEETGKQ